MGNCLETSREGQQQEGVKTQQQQQLERRQQQQQQQHEAEGRGGFIEEGVGKGGLRLKIVLTKEELEWLMFQLKDKGRKRLEDLLEELEKGRGRNEAWKPSLESIMESPEVHEIDTEFPPQ